ncbi:glutamine synthetase/guanido kinase [Wolfiporia cocos MD-104 SS10]|uniref:Glutamine synthetase n=1 Tax=Wolfiporia cocos (strain MD-104) TaxID=742152 RepID=A0A2H3JAS6_WOLCO|nr:glutamine synthetase/guanido kinase [Wolfiporia cocos MD-104 SS10]
MSALSSSQAESSYGVVYKPIHPSGTLPATLSVADLQLPARGIKYVRVQWVDLTNTVRFRVLSTAYFSRLLASPRPSIGLAHVTLGLVGAMIVPGFGVAGEHLYVVDLSSFRVCPYAPGHAMVMGWFEEKVPSPRTGSLVSELCPRALLKRIVERSGLAPPVQAPIWAAPSFLLVPERFRSTSAAELTIHEPSDAWHSAGLSFLAGFESEFILLRETSPKPVAGNHGDWTTSAKLPAGSIEERVLEEIADALQDAGIELQMYHGEAAPGQYEIVTGPLAPLEAADALVHTRETIRNVASRHGLRATFAPRLHADSCGSGAHMHFSVHSSAAASGADDAARADAARAPSLSGTERSFLSTLLAHLPALCALTLPTAASYTRAVDGIWAGGTYACWGTDNKEVPVRVCGPRGAHHFELKTVDGTANPHLVLAGVLATGMRGVGERALLTTGDCGKAAAEMSEEERRARREEAVRGGRLPAGEARG